MVWQPDILNNCYELSGGCAPLNQPPGALPLDPAGGLPFPRPPVPPTSKSWLRHWSQPPIDRRGLKVEVKDHKTCYMSIHCGVLEY